MPTIPTTTSRPWQRKTQPFEGMKRDFDYNSQRWRRTSKAFLMRHPLCARCEEEGKVTSAHTVDHVKPINVGGDAWDWANMQGLCKHHNAIKTAKQKGQSNNNGK